MLLGMSASYSLTSSALPHSVTPLDIVMNFAPTSGLEHEPFDTHLVERLYKASKKPSGLSRELEVMTMVNANTTIMNRLRERLMPRWGFAHLTPLNDWLALHNVPVSYGSMFHPSNIERYCGSYKKYTFNPKRYEWAAPRRVKRSTELVTFTFESRWFDTRWEMPSKIESFVTTTTAEAENVQQELVHLAFDNLLL